VLSGLHDIAGVEDPLPPKPLTQTYMVAASTTVIATIKITAMMGLTPVMSFHIFPIFLLILVIFITRPI